MLVSSVWPPSKGKASVRYFTDRDRVVAAEARVTKPVENDVRVHAMALSAEPELS